MARAPKTAIKEDIRALSGPERAAIFLLSLGEELGSKLRLPPWMEAARPQIEQVLPPIKIPAKQ